MTSRERPIPRWRTAVGRAVVPADQLRKSVAAGLVLAVGLGLGSALSLLSTPPPSLIPALIYLVVLGLATAVGGRRPGFLGLVLCSLAFDFFFLPPVHHLFPGRHLAPGTGGASAIETLLAFFFVGLVEVELLARARAETDRARLLGNQMIVLASVSQLLSESFDYEKSLGGVARLAATAFDGYCLIDLIQEDGSVARVAAAGTDARRDALAQALLKFPPDLTSPDHPLEQVLRSGHGEVVTNVATDFLARVSKNAEHAEIIRKLGTRSVIMAPLIARERTIGALVLASRARGRYGTAELDVAEDLATRVALAVDNARLFQAEGKARDDAVAFLERTQLLHSVAAALGQAMTPSAVADVIAGEACSALDGDRAAIAELVDEGLNFEILASRGYPEELVALWRRFPADLSGPMTEAITERHPVEGPRSLTVPLVLDSRVLGALSIGFDEPRRFGEPDLAFVATLGRQCALALERARLLETEQLSRHDAERAVARLEIISRASEMLAVSLDYPAIFHRLARLVVESLADLCLIDIREEDGSISRVAAAHADPEKQALADALRKRFAPSPGGNHPVVRVISTGEPELSREMTEAFLRETTLDQEHFRIVTELGFQSFMCVPLAVRGRILGAITLVSTDPLRRYTEEDLALPREIARRAAVRIESARLFQAEQQARAETEKARRRLQFLAEASRILSSSLDYDLTLGRVANLIVPQMADWCTVQLVSDETDQIRTVAVAHVDPSKVERVRRLQDEHPASRSAASGVSNVIRTGASELIGDVPDSLLSELTTDPEVLDTLRDLELRSSMTVPLSAHGRTLGAITFVAGESGRRYTPEDLELAEEVAGRAGLAIDNARLYHERDYIAQTLQRSLLPPHLPEIPGIELEARYYPLMAGSDVGGDFYDVFQIGRDSWTVVIGDVCGKGPDAAAVMGVARYTLRAAAMYETRPSRVLRTMSDILLGQVSDQRFCTACCARLRPDEGRARLTIASGGHPLPIVVRTTGETVAVGQPGTLLGVLPDPSLTDVVIDLGSGDSIVFYTDGLLDERHAGAGGGEERLIAVLARCAGSPISEVADALDRYLEIARTDLPRDDAAFLIVRVA